MKNRIWPLCLLNTVFFLAVQSLVASTPEDREFVGHIVRMFGTLTMVFALLHMMGGKKK